MKIWKTGLIVLVLAGCVAVAAPTLRAEDKGAEKKKDDAVPKTYAEAVKKIQALMSSIDATIKAGKYKAAHEDAAAIITVSKSLGELALAEGSGVPKDKVKEVNKTAKDLGEAADSFHDAADEEKTAVAKEHYAHMRTLVESLVKLVPK